MELSIKIFLFFLFCTIAFAQNSSLSSSQIQSKLNIINGASTECVMHHFYTNSGWTQIEGEIGRNGIDGLYYKKKRGQIREVLVAESKWNTSRLGFSGKGKTVKQMSQEWVIRVLKRLQKYKPIPEYSIILKMLRNGQYRARLFRMKPVGGNAIQISIYRIKNKGLETFDKIKDIELSSIEINAPINNFEAGILRTYNACRKKALGKYLPMLNDKQTAYLMQDNYIQGQDVVNALKDQATLGD